ncbi:MAG: sulfite exporter TauE/SafE family protein [Planctomycetota bacterium]
MDLSHPLIALALATGFIHTLAGPDHYLPFVAISRARGWSWTRTAVVTILCGVGHIAGSIILGLVGIAAGVAIFHLETVESVRGDIAAWLMIAFGVVYACWGIRRAARRPEHHHAHAHADGEVHTHDHSHQHSHVHVHGEESKAGGGSITPWVLFAIFVFGPCEVLIPQLMYPAATGDVATAVAVVTAFSLTTITTMLGMVLLLTFSLGKAHFSWLERRTHLLAGATIALCGVLILVGF